MDYKQIQQHFNNSKVNFDYKTKEYNDFLNDFEEKIKEKSLLIKNIDTIQKSKQILYEIIKSTRDEALTFMEKLVNEALKEIFYDKNIKLKIQYDGEGSRKKIDLFIIENDEEYDLFSRGGGLRQIVSLGIIIVLRYISGINTPLFIDESVNAVNSPNENLYNKNLFNFLNNVCKRLNIQIILITGRIIPEAMEIANNVILVSKNGSEKNSTIEYLK